MKFNLIALFFFIGLSESSFAQNFNSFQKILDLGVTPVVQPNKVIDPAFDYNKVLQDSGVVNLIETQKAELKSFQISRLANKDEALAFWINAYNFSMVAIVLEEGSKGQKIKISSVKDFGSFINPYKIFKQKKVKIGSAEYSLDEIEKEILLGSEYKKKGWKDARVHFAVNCASVGCPPILNKVYESSTVQTQLDENVKKALANPRHFRIQGGDVQVTHLFKWYESDFNEAKGSVKSFLLAYLTDSEAIKAVQKNSSFAFIDYSWKLNLPENFK